MFKNINNNPLFFAQIKKPGWLRNHRIAPLKLHNLLLKNALNAKKREEENYRRVKRNQLKFVLRSE
jgi:hypothetical protein